MLNIRFIVNLFGLVLIFVSFFMLLCGVVAWSYGEYDVEALMQSSAITFASGFFPWLFTREVKKDLIKRESYIVVTLVWVVISIFGALPYILSGTIPSFTNAFFETISGFTTTGASVFTDVEVLPHGILLWRSTTHFLGGMGVVVLAVAILPYFGFGGMQLYSAEAAGVTHDKLHPRIAQTAKSLWGIYVFLTGVEIIFLLFGGMDLFDAVCHSFGSMSSGGFSTKNASLAAFSPYIQYVVIVFMFFAGTNFTLFYFVWKGQFSKLRSNGEFSVYVRIIALSTAIIAVSLFFFHGYGAEQAFRSALFQVTSIITSTGFATDDYTLWHPALTFIIFLLLFSGACAGSTSGGIKIMRHHIMFRNSRLEFRRMIHPMAVVPLKLGGKTVPNEIIYKVLAFVMVYMLIFAMGSLSLAFLGLDMDSAMGAAATAMAGAGPGIGTVGPASNFFAVPDLGKWILSFLMLLGRLELFSVLILFSPDFWRNN